MQLLTKAEACEILKISIRTLERLHHDGEFPYYRISGCIRIEMADLEAYVRRNRTQVKTVSVQCPKHGKKKAQKERIQYVPGMKVVG